MERAQSDERVQSSKTKLTDTAILEELVNAHRLLEPGESSAGLTNLVVGSLDTNGEVDDSGLGSTTDGDGWSGKGRWSGLGTECSVRA